MRYSLLLASAAAVALWAGAAAADSGGSPETELSPETQCQVAKIEASSRYLECLLRVEAQDKAGQLGSAKDTAIAVCDARYQLLFERAESSAGVSCSPPDATVAMEAIKAQAAAATGTCTNASSPCTSLTTFTQGNETRVACLLKATYCGVDLSDVISQAAAKFPGFVIDDDTTLWIQAWASWGADGNGSTVGSGNQGGYAQTVTTVNDFKAANDGSTQLYYYLGEQGSHASDSGGQGAAATLVTKVDLTINPTQDPQVEDVYLIAGGGGGGGGDNAGAFCISSGDKNGGQGGIAIATTDAIGSGNGSNGEKGGQGGAEGSGSGGGSEGGFGGRGGPNGRSSLGYTTWSNTGTTTLAFTAGQGGTGGDAGSGCDCPSGGAGGGGGWGGGGGGSHACDATSGSGGGGASYAVQSTKADNCAPQPSTSSSEPTNPVSVLGQDAAVQITIDLTPNVCE